MPEARDQRKARGGAYNEEERRSSPCLRNMLASRRSLIGSTSIPLHEGVAHEEREEGRVFKACSKLMEKKLSMSCR